MRHPVETVALMKAVTKNSSTCAGMLGDFRLSTASQSETQTGDIANPPQTPSVSAAHFTVAAPCIDMYTLLHCLLCASDSNDSSSA